MIFARALAQKGSTKIRRTRHAGHRWRSRDEFINDVLLWTPSHSRAKAGQPARIYIQQFCEDTGSNPVDLPELMNDREGWRERVSDICADGKTRWWWIGLNSGFSFSQTGCHTKIKVHGLPYNLHIARRSRWIRDFRKGISAKGKHKQLRPGVELSSLFLFPTTITLRRRDSIMKNFMQLFY